MNGLEGQDLEAPDSRGDLDTHLVPLFLAHQRHADGGADTEMLGMAIQFLRKHQRVGELLFGIQVEDRDLGTVGRPGFGEAADVQAGHLGNALLQGDELILEHVPLGQGLLVFGIL